MTRLNLLAGYGISGRKRAATLAVAMEDTNLPSYFFFNFIYLFVYFFLIISFSFFEVVCLLLVVVL